MLLKRLEMLGFKSFANRSSFEFESGISCLVGPNGSGKSNVADAVRWVLGEQSARALRGKKAEEVIFVGSAGRQPLGMAEAALVLDNSEGRLSLDYGEVRLARRLYRSGESEYLINGSRARRKDLVALLLEVGLHTEGYTVIGQGAVEELVMQRPEERRAVLEHAADITRHQSRLAEARSKLASTDQNLIRCQDLIAELEPHARRLRTQAERAERYAARRAELAAVAQTYYRAALAEKIADEEAASTSLSRATDEQRRLEAQIAAHERERSSGREQLATLEAEAARLRGDLERGHAERASLLAEIAAARQRMGFGEARAEALASEAERATSRIAELEAEVSDQAQAAPCLPEHDARELDRLERLVKSLSSEQEQARAKIEATRASQASLSQERQRLESELELERTRQAGQRQALAEVEVRRAAAESRLAEIEDEVQGITRELEASERRRTEATQKLEASRAAADALRQRLVAAVEREQALRGDLEVARANLAVISQEAHEQEDAGERSNSAPSARLGSSLAVEPEYELAVTAALGEWARAKLVSNPARALSTLPDASNGRSLFLRAASEMNGHAKMESSFTALLGQKLAGIWHRPALELFGCTSNGSKPPPLGPLAFTVIVRDLADARIAADRLADVADCSWQITTLNGQVVTHYGGWAQGAETGPGRLVSLRRREAEAGSRMAALQGALDQASGDREAVQVEVAAAQDEEHGAQAADLAAEAETRSLTRRREEILASSAHLEASRESLLTQEGPNGQFDEETALQTQLRELARRSTALARQEAIEAEAVQTLQACWESALGEREQEARRAEQARLAQVEQRARQELIAARRREIERISQEHSQVGERAEALASELGEQRVKLEGLDGQAVQLATAIGGKAAQLEELAARRAEHQGELDGIETKLVGLRQRSSQAQAAREAALLARQQAADELGSLKHEAEATAEEWGIASEGLVQLRLTPLPPLWGTKPGDGGMELAIDLPGTRRRLVSLQRELRGQGATSESLLDEYREVEQRLGFLTVQSTDLRAAMAELEGVIDELEGLMRQSFAEAFERVNAAFEKTFATLFGGGTARLVLTDPADPLQAGVDIVAQPPGKRLQNLMSLSGGERALTSTALIFALLSTNPLPFCVLDEVDAALDESNARRFADLLMEYAERTQFIIITHNRVTMETASSLYGISMGGDGVTTVVSLRPSEVAGLDRNRQTVNGPQPVLQA